MHDSELTGDQCMECETRSYAVHDPMHVFFKLPRPVDIPLEVDYQMLPILCVFHGLF